MVELCEFAAVKTKNAVVYHASNLDVLPLMADNSVDSIVCDPPYELGFMGKAWDSTGIAYSVELWRECLRVLKPGGHILAFGGSRTWHRVAVAIEDAGFELRDSIAWLYGSGFPKSLDIAKAIQKASGVEPTGFKENEDGHFYGSGQYNATPRQLFMPELEGEAKQWQGWGTALKPAFEPIVVGRKPLIGTVAANVLVWGVGGLNIDASRIGTEERINQPAGNKVQDVGVYKFSVSESDAFNGAEASSVQGRWPANIILDDFTAGLLDEQSGETSSRSAIMGNGTRSEGWNLNTAEPTLRGHNDSGGASRFFYVAKASKTDRNEGLEELPDVIAGHLASETGGGGGWSNDSDKNPNLPRKNFHPTVKPTDLMRYLIKLVTPAGGVVLDPFTGSGSTGKAALLDGYRFIGIEMTADYLPIIEGRLLWAEAEAQRVAQAAAEEESIRLF